MHSQFGRVTDFVNWLLAVEGQSFQISLLCDLLLAFGIFSNVILQIFPILVGKN